MLRDIVCKNNTIFIRWIENKKKSEIDFNSQIIADYMYVKYKVTNGELTYQQANNFWPI